MKDFTVHIAVLYLVLRIPSAQSLKDKRMVLRSIKDRIRKRFNVSLSELDEKDKWQLATLGIVMIGDDNRHIDACLQSITELVASCPDVEISDSQIQFL